MKLSLAKNTERLEGGELKQSVIGQNYVRSELVELSKKTLA
jgi:hypothetical protein